MARNRQRAKERKQRQRRDPDLGSVDDAADEIVHPSLAAGGAPPSDLGTVHPVDFDDDDGEPADAVDSGAGAADVAAPPAKRRGGLRVAGFVKACWAELQRVQWPDRKQVGQATAVVLGFVVIAGAFLGLADVVAQRIVNLIL
jgi:preprotein translocase SecE subunit